MSEPILLSPDDVATPRLGVARLTRMAFQGVDLRSLWHEWMETATDDKAGSGMAMDLSVIAQLLGDQATGLAIQKDTLVYQRLYHSPCAAATPRLKVLAFAAAMDIGGNTPLEFLLEGSDIALTTFYLVPGMALPRPLPEHDVAIVVAPDSAAAHPALAMMETLAPVWPRPILNRPDKVRGLDRDRLYRLLDGIAGLVIPQTARVGRERLTQLAAGRLPVRNLLSDGGFPLIIRPVGSHAGFGLVRLEDGAALASYLAGREEAEFFLSRFVDYASADGMFRKYRIVAIDGRPYACHMAIAEEWKVWYLNADMAVSVSNRTEEAMFMHGFDEDFAVRHGAALGEMIARIGLEYVTIDCAETQAGELLIFEADNAAIVHDMDPPSVYPYKPVQMQKIFKAVQTMFDRYTNRKTASAA